MVEIKIDNTGDGTWWLYNSNQGWKDYCGCENFDEQVVLTGNRDFTVVISFFQFLYDNTDSFFRKEKQIHLKQTTS